MCFNSEGCLKALLVLGYTLRNIITFSLLGIIFLFCMVGTGEYSTYIKISSRMSLELSVNLPAFQVKLHYIFFLVAPIGLLQSNFQMITKSLTLKNFHYKILLLYMNSSIYAAAGFDGQIKLGSVEFCFSRRVLQHG